MTPSRRLFILGNPRSGTSLLRLMLTMHSDISIPPESGFIVWLYSKYKSWSGSDSMSLTNRSEFLEDLYNSRKFDTWDLDRDDLDAMIQKQNPSTYAALCDLVGMTYALQAGKACKVLGDKNNFHIHYLDILNEIYPGSLFIHIIRDGRDVACSYREVMSKSFKSPYAPKLKTKIKEIALEWKHSLNMVDRFLSSVESERKFCVRYEDLTCEPSVVLGRVCHWLNISIQSQMIDFYLSNRDQSIEPALTMEWKQKLLNPVSRSGVQRYISELSPGEINDFNCIAANELEFYEYV